MTITIKKERTDEKLLEQVKQDSGVNLDLCLQCRKCSHGCPAATYTGTSPSEIIRMLQLGAGDEILDQEFIWLCASCGTCYERCPMKINMADVVDSLRIIASAKNAKVPAGNMPYMNSLLLSGMKKFGRTYDLGAMLQYKAGTFSFRDALKFPMILKKGKIALLPAKGADVKLARRIFRNTENMRKY